MEITCILTTSLVWFCKKYVIICYKCDNKLTRFKLGLQIHKLQNAEIITKELSFCQKVLFSNLYIFVTQCCRP